MKVSIIIPVYNERAVIDRCLLSLANQTLAKKLQIIVVDDGSTDKSQAVVGSRKSVVLLQQQHNGPGAARNFGASHATGDVLVFVDADMEFEPDFVEKLIAPIVQKKAIGTFSKEEYLLNKDKPLARLWNLNLGRKGDKMEPRDFDKNKNKFYRFLKRILESFEKTPVMFPSNKSHVFRAILKTEFDKVGGFDTAVGYTDDWSLAAKLGTLAEVAPGAKYYHRNPESYLEVWRQARWFGKNEFLTRNIIRRIYNLLRYNPVLGVAKGIVAAVMYKEVRFIFFKIVYDTAIFVSVALSFISEPKSK